MPFCHAPWTNIDISPQGDIAPCCKFQMSYYDSKFNVQSQSLDQYFDSKFLFDVRQEFLQDIWPKGCERCKIEEQNLIPSKRQLDYERWHLEYDAWSPEQAGCITASVAFGNICNLKCITCSSHSSSRWRNESLALTGQAYDTVKFYKQDFLDQLISRTPKLKHLDIPGGEPLLSGVQEQHRLLTHYIESGQAANMTLHYTTNATIFPDQHWWDLWQHFAQVDIQLSIDAVESKFEYIRYPANWNNLCASVEQYLKCSQPNLKISVSHTVSAFNIFYLDEFLTWCDQTGLPSPWLGKVHNPKHLRPTVWPDLTRQKIIAKLQMSNFSQVNSWILMLQHIDDSEWYPQFCHSVRQHDQYRALSFESVFPEMASWLE